jgi:hypothetical protein
VELQAVRQAAGLPDALPATQIPGIAGAWAKLANGAEVLVEFIEGDPSQPIVTGFTPKGGGGFVPERLTLGATSENEASDAARKGDTVKCLQGPAVFVGTINGLPATGVITPTLPYVLGSITSGSSKVGIAT